MLTSAVRLIDRPISTPSDGTSFIVTLDTDGTGLGVGVSVGVGDGVGSCVGDGIGVSVGVGAGPSVGVGVSSSVGDGSPVGSDWDVSPPVSPVLSASA